MDPAVQRARRSMTEGEEWDGELMGMEETVTDDKV